MRQIAASILVMTLLLAAGCGRKESASVPPAPAEPAGKAEAPAVDAAPAQAAPAQVEVELVQAQAALDSRDYEKAATTLLTVERQPRLDPAQAMSAKQAMSALQSKVAQAAAAGDPNAKAAADRLRAAAAARHQ